MIKYKIRDNQEENDEITCWLETDRGQICLIAKNDDHIEKILRLTDKGALITHLLSVHTPFKKDSAGGEIIIE